MHSVLTLAIPTRNGSRYLGDTLRSLDRNRPAVRWWLQDSCSTDETAVIARRYASDAERVIVEMDTGQPDGLNRAFEHMGGEIIGYINSDDCLAEGAAEAVLAEFAADPDLDLLYGEVEWVDAQGRVTGHHTGSISNLTEILDIYRVWWNGRQWVQPEVFWRRRLWERVGPFNIRYDLTFDYEYWVRCFQAGAKVKRIPRVLARFRIHPGQKSSSSAAAANEIRDIVSEALASDPPIPASDLRRLGSMLGYDRYQAGQDYAAANGRPSLTRMLLRRPDWLLVPEVRRRVRASLQRQVPGGPARRAARPSGTG